MSRSDKRSGGGPPERAPGVEVSRRGFLKGAGFTVAAVGLTGPAATGAVETDEEVPVFGPGPVPVELRINGQKHAVRVEPMTTLLETLREHLDLTGSKRVCDRGFCGACTVLLDGRTVNACSMLAVDAVGREITTIEGIADAETGKLSPIQDAFIACDALQCGFCTPGMIIACTALLEANPKPSRDQVQSGIAGNVCRCGTYQNIFEAVDLVVRKRGD